MSAKLWNSTHLVILQTPGGEAVAAGYYRVSGYQRGAQNRCGHFHQQLQEIFGYIHLGLQCRRIGQIWGSTPSSTTTESTTVTLTVASATGQAFDTTLDENISSTQVNDGIAELGEPYFVEIAIEPEVTVEVEVEIETEIEAEIEAIVPVTVEIPTTVDIEQTSIVTTTQTAPG